MKIKTVLLEITDKCNLSCTHCMNRPDQKGIETSFDKIEKLFYRLDDFFVEKIYISGGEPLMHSEIDKIIKLCTEFPKIMFVVTTNGLLLNENILRLMNQYENIIVQFSVDGISKKTYEMIRGKDTFEIFQEKISLWNSLTERYGLGRTCLNRLNYKELPEIYAFCIRYNLHPSFIFVSSLGHGKKNWKSLELNLAQKIWCIDVINKLNVKYGCNVLPPEAPATCNFTENMGVGSLLVRADGRVAPCQFFYDESLGNIFEDDVMDIISNDNPWTKKHREMAQKRKQMLENSLRCKSCKIKEGCNFGCMGLADSQGNIMSYDGLCDFRVMTAVCYSKRLITLNNDVSKKNVITVD